MSISYCAICFERLNRIKGQQKSYVTFYDGFGYSICWVCNQCMQCYFCNTSTQIKLYKYNKQYRIMCENCDIKMKNL